MVYGLEIKNLDKVDIDIGEELRKKKPDQRMSQQFEEEK
jgi:hypothetical protein